MTSSSIRATNNYNSAPIDESPSDAVNNDQDSASHQSRSKSESITKSDGKTDSLEIDDSNGFERRSTQPQSESTKGRIARLALISPYEFAIEFIKKSFQEICKKSNSDKNSFDGTDLLNEQTFYERICPLSSSQMSRLVEDIDNYARHFLAKEKSSSKVQSESVLNIYLCALAYLAVSYLRGSLNPLSAFKGRELRNITFSVGQGLCCAMFISSLVDYIKSLNRIDKSEKMEQAIRARAQKLKGIITDVQKSSHQKRQAELHESTNMILSLSECT